MGFSASDVKTLRDKTGAGMMKCKEALTETNGDVEAAVDYLRKKGLAAAAKKQSRVAAEGRVETLVSGKKALILEVNCETDFVAKGEDFQNFVKEAAKRTADEGHATVESLKDALGETVNELTMKCGEKIDLRRLVYKETAGAFGSYNHGGKIGVLIEVDVDTAGKPELEELLKDLSMHIAASAPKFITADDIDESFKKREAEIYAGQLKEEGKPENMIEKIVEGKLAKLAKEVCLLEQKFVKNPDQSVKDLIKEVGGKVGATVNVKGFEMLTLGEGVEKKEDNLADEVAKMTGKQ